MKKIIFIILTILLIALAITGYYVYNIMYGQKLAEENNKEYANYYEKEIVGTSLISLINKAANDNEKNGVNKIKNTIYYEDNGENSIQITIKFLESDEIKRMEAIELNGSETFNSFFATALFKCTKIEYHEKTNFVKSLHFEQI